jgi:hypothetical protein
VRAVAEAVELVRHVRDVDAEGADHQREVPILLLEVRQGSSHDHKRGGEEAGLSWCVSDSVVLCVHVCACTCVAEAEAPPPAR